MEKVWKKLKIVKQELKRLNSTHFAGVKERITTIRKKLDDIQEQMDETN